MARNALALSNALRLSGDQKPPIRRLDIVAIGASARGVEVIPRSGKESDEHRRFNKTSKPSRRS
jgi:hypothetical protein